MKVVVNLKSNLATLVAGCRLQLAHFLQQNCEHFATLLSTRTHLEQSTYQHRSQQPLYTYTLCLSHSNSYYICSFTLSFSHSCKRQCVVTSNVFYLKLKFELDTLKKLSKLKQTFYTPPVLICL